MHLIDLILQKNPKKRYSFEQIIDHCWFKEVNYLLQRYQLNPNILENMAKYKVKNKIQMGIYKIIVSQISNQSEFKDLIDTFKALDENNDGVLSRDEIRKGFHKVNIKMKKQQFQALMNQIDNNGSNFIDYTEFIIAGSNRHRLLNRRSINNCFKLFDADNSGKISMDEFKAIFDNRGIIDTNDTLWNQFLKECDENGDGEIEIDEFRNMLNTLLDQ